MCGIIGYIGKRNAIPILMDGLKRLEYRGYDSAGLVAITEMQDNTNAMLIREKGRVANLENKIKTIYAKELSNAHVGIAHTRWATHGEPSEKNCHPHADCNENIFVVHNGIIENYADLKQRLVHDGHTFASDTDTEVLSHLIEHYYRDNPKHITPDSSQKKLLRATQSALKEVRGTYGIAVVHKNEPDKIIAARMASPLLIGIGEKEYIVASDASAILQHTNHVVYLNDGEIAEITNDAIIIETVNGEAVHHSIETLDVEITNVEKNGHPHFMHKEIFETPDVVTNALRGRIDPEQKNIILDELAAIKKTLNNVQNIIIVACGTAAHAGYIAKYMIETYVGIPVEVDIGSEFRYRHPVVRPNTLAIAITQSGETADTLASIREAKRQGALTLGIVNVVGSTIARETDAVIYNHAGPEISVASTKAFVSQLTIITIFTMYLAQQRNHDAFSIKERVALIAGLGTLPDLLRQTLKQEEIIKTITETYSATDHMFFLGRNHNFPIALEGALKLKEVAYVHAEGYASGEFKHGPIAMIDTTTPTFFIIPRDRAYEKTKSNLEEIKARGGPVITLTTEGNNELKKWTEDCITIPECNEALIPILAAIPLYLFSYHVATLRGCDVDKPRNLAKSVTVE